MKVASLWRHPIKSHGREALERVTLKPGEAMPWDRVWAVAHEAAQIDDGAWAPCVNFSRVSKAPALMAITCETDEASGRLTLRHPERPDLTFDPQHEPGALLGWVSPLVPQDRALPARLVRLEGRGWTDSDFPSVTIASHSSHRAVEQKLGRPLSIHRWRANIWIDGAPLWEEFDWIGREVQIGEAILRVSERTDRCAATTANPETGRRDADTLGALSGFGHQDFSVRAEVIRGGLVALDDAVRPL